MIEGNTYTREAVHLPTLALTNDTLDGYNFEDCLLIGPAVIALVDACTFVDNHIEGGWDAVMWELPPDRLQIVGAIGLRRCSIARCRLERIGICGPPQLINALALVSTAVDGLDAPPEELL